MTNAELIEKAASVIKEKKVGEYTIANVGCALKAGNGKVYLGVCIDTGSSMGFCAEPNAIGSMITDGEYEIKKIVAVWKDKDGNIYTPAPCGKCREFMKQIDEGNLDTEVILGLDKVVKLRDLLPYHNWWQKVE